MIRWLMTNDVSFYFIGDILKALIQACDGWRSKFVKNLMFWSTLLVQQMASTSHRSQ